MVSLLRRTRYSPLARWIASLTASGMPRSVGVRTTSTLTLAAAAMPARYSTVPSSEPMSIKINSNGSRLYQSRLGTHNLVYSSVPQQGTMIDTSPDRAATFLSGGGGRVVVAPFPDFSSSAISDSRFQPRNTRKTRKKKSGFYFRVFRVFRGLSSFFAKDPVHNVSVRLGLVLVLGPGVFGDQVDKEEVFLLMPQS